MITLFPDVTSGSCAGDSITNNDDVFHYSQHLIANQVTKNNRMSLTREVQ